VVITQTVVAEVEGGQMAGQSPAVDIGDNIRRDELARDPGLFSHYHDPNRKESGPETSGRPRHRE
jgi:hypothetical protein